MFSWELYRELDERPTDADPVGRSLFRPELLAIALYLAHQNFAATEPIVNQEAGEACPRNLPVGGSKRRCINPTLRFVVGKRIGQQLAKVIIETTKLRFRKTAKNALSGRCEFVFKQVCQGVPPLAFPRQ